MGCKDFPQVGQNCGNTSPSSSQSFAFDHGILLLHGFDDASNPLHGASAVSMDPGMSETLNMMKLEHLRNLCSTIEKHAKATRANHIDEQ